MTSLLTYWAFLFIYFVHARSAADYRIELDQEEGVKNYVEIEDPEASQIRFIPHPCPGKSVLHISCKDASKYRVQLVEETFA